MPQLNEPKSPEPCRAPAVAGLLTLPPAAAGGGLVSAHFYDVDIDDLDLDFDDDPDYEGEPIRGCWSSDAWVAPIGSPGRAPTSPKRRAPPRARHLPARNGRRPAAPTQHAREKGQVGRPPNTEPYLFQRPGRSLIWHMSYRGAQASASTTNERVARQKGKDFKRKIDAARAGTTPADDVTIGTLLRAELAWRVTVNGDAKAKPYAARLNRLLPFWEHRRFKDVNDGTVDGFCEHMRKYSAKEGRSISDGALRRLIATVGQVAKLHAEKHGLERPRYRLPKKGKSRALWLSRQEVARLICAARGRTWDIEEGGWLRDAEGRLIIRPMADRDRTRPLARFILMGVYTGSRRRPLLQAAWKREPGRSHVHLVRSKKLCRFFRRGWNEGIGGKKKSPTVRLAPQLIRLLRRWRARDAREKSLDYVVGFAGGSKSVLDAAWREVRLAAGFGPSVTPHVLRHTCATWLLEGGATLADTAKFCGMTVVNLKTSYMQHDPQFAMLAGIMMDRRCRDPLTGRPVEHLLRLKATLDAD